MSNRPTLVWAYGKQFARATLVAPLRGRRKGGIEAPAERQIQADAVDALQSLQFNEVCFVGKLAGLEVRNPQQVPAASHVLHGGNAYRLGPGLNRALVQGKSLRQQLLVGQRVLDFA